jgi:hypothetical protein
MRLVLESLTDVMQRVWGVENSGDQLTRNTTDGGSVDVHIDNPAEELNYREFYLCQQTSRWMMDHLLT